MLFPNNVVHLRVILIPSYSKDLSMNSGAGLFRIDRRVRLK